MGASPVTAQAERELSGDVGLQEYLAVLRQRWLTVVVTAGLFIALASVIGASRQPVYESSIDLFVLARNAEATVDHTASLLAEDRAETYAELIETRRVAEAVIQDLDLSADAGHIAAQLDGQARPDSVMIAATARDTTPERAQALASSVGRVLPTVVRELEHADERDGASVGGVSIDIVPVGSAPLPTSPASDPFLALLLIGGMVGLVAGLALALVRHRFDPIVRQLDDLAHLPAPVIGIVDADAGLDPGGAKPAANDERYQLVRLSLERLGADTTSVLITTSGPERRSPARAAQSLARAFGAAGMTAKIVDLHGLSTARIQAALDEVRSEGQHVVLILGPPVLTSVDGVLIATQVSSVLLVVHGGRSKKADVQRAVELLATLGVQVWLLLVERSHPQRSRRKAPLPEPVGHAVLRAEQPVP
jgi:capsular polysaccharide biosynthesis protein